jgi:hypothetical protein
MGFWSTVGGMFGIGDSSSDLSQTSSSSFTDSSHDDFAVNPATGLPMVGGTGGVDVHGNPYGTDINEHHSVSLHDSFNDSSFDHGSTWDCSSDSSSSFSSSDW